MSVSYRIEIDRGDFGAGGEWRSLVFRDGMVVNAFVGGSALVVANEANSAIHWHEDNAAEAADLHSVKA